MTVGFERDAMLAALRQVAGAVEARNTIPVLGNLLVVAAGGGLTVMGTNLDQYASARIEASGDIRTTVDKEKLLAAVTSFKSGSISMQAVAGRAAVTLRQGRGVRTLPTLSADDFPKPIDWPGAVHFDIASGVLARLIDATHQAQSTDETRYYLGGVFLHVFEGQLTAAAADGFRLLRAETTAPDGADAMPDVIIPARAIAQLRGMLAKGETTVRMSVTAEQISFAIGSTTLTTKAVDGTFPDYRRKIPTADGTVITAAREQLIDAPAAVVSVCNAEGDKFKVRAVAIDLTASDGPEVWARDQSGNEAREPLTLEVAGTPIVFGVNQKFLAQAAGIFAEGAMVTLAIDAPLAAMRLASDRDPDLLAVVMPLRV